MSEEVLSLFKLVWHHWSWWFYNSLYQLHCCSLLFFSMNLTVIAWICVKNVIYSMTNLMFSSLDSLTLKESISLQKKRRYLTKRNILRINLLQSHSPSNKHAKTCTTCICSDINHILHVLERFLQDLSENLSQFINLGSSNIIPLVSLPIAFSTILIPYDAVKFDFG